MSDNKCNKDHLRGKQILNIFMEFYKFHIIIYLNAFLKSMVRSRNKLCSSFKISLSFFFYLTLTKVLLLVLRRQESQVHARRTRSDLQLKLPEWAVSAIN